MTLPLLSALQKAGGKRKSGEEDSKKPKKPKPGLSPTGGLPPGSMTATFKFINHDKWLVASGRVWFLDAIAKHLGVSINGPCWPFLLSLCSEANRPSRCPSWGKPHHESATSAAHLLKLRAGKTFNLQELASDARFSWPATAQEKANLASNRLSDQPNQSQPPHQSDKGKGRGRGRAGYVRSDGQWQGQLRDEDHEGETHREPPEADPRGPSL